MIKVVPVELGKRHHAVKIPEGDLAFLKRDQPILAQFAQHTVDVCGAITRGQSFRGARCAPLGRSMLPVTLNPWAGSRAFTLIQSS